MDYILSQFRKYYPNLIKDDTKSSTKEIVLRLDLGKGNEEDVEMFRMGNGVLMSREKIRVQPTSIARRKSLVRSGRRRRKFRTADVPSF